MIPYIHMVPIRISTEGCRSIISLKSTKTSGIKRKSQVAPVFTLIQNIDCTVYDFIRIESTKNMSRTD